MVIYWLSMTVLFNKQRVLQGVKSVLLLFLGFFLIPQLRIRVECWDRVAVGGEIGCDCLLLTSQASRIMVLIVFFSDRDNHQGTAFGRTFLVFSVTRAKATLTLQGMT